MKLVVCALAERTVSQIGNPMIDLDLCGRKGIRSNVCDPDGLVTVEQGCHSFTPSLHFVILVIRIIKKTYYKN